MAYKYFRVPDPFDPLLSSRNGIMMMQLRAHVPLCVLLHQILATGGGSSVSGGGGGGSSSSNGSSPSHQPPLTSKGSKKGSASKRFRGLSIRRRMSDAYGVVALNARRPSLRNLKRQMSDSSKILMVILLLFI